MFQCNMYENGEAIQMKCFVQRFFLIFILLIKIKSVYITLSILETNDIKHKFPLVLIYIRETQNTLL